MIVLSGGDIVLPDRMLAASLLIDGDRIVAIEPRMRAVPGGASIVDASGTYIVPGFVDVHVHGVEGHDTLGGAGALAAIARRMPRYGVTAFCPTTVACDPSDLRRVLAGVARARAALQRDSARVLPAHLESNFINPDYRGAQPASCLRVPGGGAGGSVGNSAGDDAGRGAGGHVDGSFTGREILEVIAASRADVGIITLAPELPGGIDLVKQLVAAGHRVSLGHSGATFDEAVAAIEAGASHATHLFNRMPPLGHRDPGLAGAVLARDDVAAELICDGVHVHPAMCRMAIAAKGTGGVMAITDGTAGSGLPPGSTARLGRQDIRVSTRAAVLADGTLAGSTLTMDGAFRTIVTQFGFSIVEAALLCSTTPARQLGLDGCGALAAGAIADIVLLDRELRVVRTFVAGREVYRR